ncbi:hypothetical protein GCM10010222_27410 [Streptomyces tanashiensis]|uniref:hypothetical protein n=1 Tax=Streptomyces tanashiensis TaxID=67367 RepID=UPI00199A6594|nr:hypothetical protein [Streptomyces tanashiensis]GGS84297.1 hypothetical protein GCM10010222_27410 [Streptomyces tanashiensis]
MALASAVATLLAALFLCLGTGPDGERAHHEEGPRATGVAGGTAGVTAEAAAVTGEYVCPYDRGGCSLFPSLSPAVLSAPPLDPPLHAAGGAPRLAPPSGDGPARRSDARPRAPDLHVLQVLRT